MQNKMKFLYYKAVVVLIMISAISCVPLNKVRYFNDINELTEPVPNPKEQKTIMPFDNLYIKVISIDEKTNLIFNSSDELRYSTSGSSGMIGYLVSDKGNINFPFVGLINVAGLTTDQASKKMQDALNDYISNTAVVVKFIDNKVSIIGEVQRQGVYSFTQEKLNIYEALSLGGGLTRYGDHNNIVLIRQEGDKIMHHKLNLSDSRIAAKDYYYIMPNDVIVVEPMKAISSSYSNITYTTILTSVTTLIAVLLFTGVKF
jgi:polysaccharide export outer membrane protein